MGDFRARVRAGVPAGVLATIVMDASMLAAAAIGGEAFRSDRLDVAVIGRWGNGVLRGRWRHEDASAEPTGALDLPLGFATHYLTGIGLTEAFIVFSGGRRRRSFRSALVYGVGTSVLPLFVLFPSLGYGPFGLRSGEAAKLCRTMLVGHLGFGAGIGLGISLALRSRA